MVVADIGQRAEALRREFHGPCHPEFLAWREPLPDGVTTIDWTLSGSRDAPFVRHLGLKRRRGSSRSITPAR